MKIELPLSQLTKIIKEQLLSEEVRQPFDMQLPDDLVRLAQSFKRAGHPLYVVGGAVRDALQGKEPKDYDVATGATPNKIIQILRNLPNSKIIEVGAAFGVIKVITPEGNEYEIATLRVDEYI